ncbi:MAG: ABC transporter permease [Verrucomicrobiae bacterium]|nr:ABC transporter permease [Verrucomicrobiae bacterium]MDW8344634.1 ABC transporter permease [Verrucomicrobiae bacterium]
MRPVGRGRRWYQTASGRWGLVLLVPVVWMAVGAPWLARHAPTAQPYRERALAAPSRQHWLGVDAVGRDVWTRLVYGARTTLGVALAATMLAVGAGTVLAVSAVQWRGWWEMIVVAVVDFLLAFPPILLGLVAMTVLPPSPGSVAVAVGVASLPAVVRQVRTALLSELGKEYVLAARAAGAGRVRVMWVEVLPNCVSVVVAMATVTVGSAVLEAAGLAFLGLAGQPDVPEWGAMLREERSLHVLAHAPWVVLAPGGAIVWTVLGCQLLADSLRAGGR